MGEARRAESLDNTGWERGGWNQEFSKRRGQEKSSQGQKKSDKNCESREKKVLEAKNRVREMEIFEPPVPPTIIMVASWLQLSRPYPTTMSGITFMPEIP